MSDFKARAIGMVGILIGLAAVWFFGLRAVAAAWQGTGPVVLSGKAYAIGPICIVTGLFMIVGGGRVGQALLRPSGAAEDYRIGAAMVAVAALAGFAGWWWIIGELEAVGLVRG